MLKQTYLDGSTVEVIDGKVNYDILLTRPCGKETKIEVKFDSWIDNTRNLLAEMWSSLPAKNLGWIFSTEAEYLFYVSQENLYLIKMSKLQEITKSIVNMEELTVDREKLHNMGCKKAFTKNKFIINSARNNPSVKNFLLDLDDCIHLGIVKKVWTRKEANIDVLTLAKCETTYNGPLEV